MQYNSLNNVLISFIDNTKQTVFFKDFPIFKVTEGVKFAADNYSLRWLLMIIFSVQNDGLLKNNERLQFWHLQRVSDDEVLVFCTCPLGILLYYKKIDNKSFYFDYLKLFWVDGLLLLPSETKGSQ